MGSYGWTNDESKYGSSCRFRHIASPRPASRERTELPTLFPYELPSVLRIGEPFKDGHRILFRGRTMALLECVCGIPV